MGAGVVGTTVDDVWVVAGVVVVVEVPGVVVEVPGAVVVVVVVPGFVVVVVVPGVVVVVGVVTVGVVVVVVVVAGFVVVVVVAGVVVVFVVVGVVFLLQAPRPRTSPTLSSTQMAETISTRRFIALSSPCLTFRPPLESRHPPQGTSP